MKPLRPDVRALIDGATRDEPDPSPEVRARMKAAIFAQVIASSAVAGAAHAAPTGGAATSVGIGLVTKVVITSAVASVMATGAWQWMRERSATVDAPIVAPAPHHTTAIVSSTITVPAPQVAPVTSPLPTPAPTPPAARPAPARPARSSPTPSPIPTQQPVLEVDEHADLVEQAANALAEETSLLEQGENEAAEDALIRAIETALAAGHGTHARELLDRLRAEHPQATPDEVRRALESRVRRSVEGTD